jgi:multicomponent Na+:H+ antiporter subunit B
MKQTPNNMMLQTFMRLIAVVVFTFSIYIFLVGHNEPGGGFVGGLMTASAIVVLYLVFDLKTITKAVPLNFIVIIGIGLLFGALTGVVSVIFGYPFLTQFFDYFTFPIFGEVELTTALVFDLGVYLVVVGAALTIITTIAEDDEQWKF